MKSKVLLGLVVAQVATILGSWLVAAALPSLSVRSLLGGEGIRWFFGQFINNITSPILGWIVLSAFALSAFLNSNILAVLRRMPHVGTLSFRQRYAFWLSLVVMAVIIVVIMLLTVVPQAILLSPTGSLFPGSFSRSIIPILALSVIVVSLVFGLASGRFHGVSQLYDALVSRTSLLPDAILFYVLIIQLAMSVLFVLGR